MSRLILVSLILCASAQMLDAEVWCHRGLQGYLWSGNFDKLTAYYYQLKPYLFKAPDGKLQGIMYETVLNNLKQNCKTKIAHMKEVSESNISAMLTSGNMSIPNHASNILIISLQQKATDEFLNSQNFLQIPVHLSPGMVVIVPRYRISLWNKLATGLNETYYLFVVVFMFIVTYGILVWLIERTSNEEFDKGYLGALKGVWLGIVTMTTLGYGDITPRTICGKLLTVLCVLVGLLIASLLAGRAETIRSWVDTSSTAMGARTTSVLKYLEHRNACVGPADAIYPPPGVEVESLGPRSPLGSIVTCCPTVLYVYTIRARVKMPNVT